MHDPQERAVVTEYYVIPSTSHKISLQHITLKLEVKHEMPWQWYRLQYILLGSGTG
jgi:hypothetical protein